ncbi:hypothetical protein O6P43_031979 [Quillaja saponaria]|uniref:Uncharacterized protein n=1 Tax=Quillaja saponaria TaxID=32244 RepID=A0AAD7KWK1_QUISA|nr:hypothetical protein O6P43_031979 [Quillaja saponaria]
MVWGQIDSRKTNLSYCGLPFKPLRLKWMSWSGEMLKIAEGRLREKGGERESDPERDLGMLYRKKKKGEEQVPLPFSHPVPHLLNFNFFFQIL